MYRENYIFIHIPTQPEQTGIYQSIFTPTHFVIYFIFIFKAQQPKVGRGPLFIEVPRSQTHTHTHIYIHTHTHTHTQAYQARQEPSGRVISSTLRTLPDNTQHYQETDIHAPSRIRTRILSERAAADPRLRPRGHCDQSCTVYNCSSDNISLLL